MRLGKYTSNKSRPIKAYFNNSETPKYLLRIKVKLPENIKLYADQTPTQRCFVQSLREKLNKRIENGEKDLIYTLKACRQSPQTITTKKTSYRNNTKGNNVIRIEYLTI